MDIREAKRIVNAMGASTRKFKVLWYVRDNGKWEMYAGNALIVDAANEKEARKKAREYLSNRYYNFPGSPKEWKLSGHVEIVDAEGDTLATMVNKHRNIAVAKYGVQNLAGKCEGVVSDLIDDLESAGIKAWFVNGHYDVPFKWSEGDESPFSGHSWVETDKYILDPTREQFGSNKLVIAKSDPDAKFYLHLS